MPLDTRIHTYVIGTNGLDLKDLSARKQAGTNDVQPRFIEGGAKILFANKPVDNIGPFKIQTVDVSQAQDLTPTILFENADMPDWN